MKLSDSPGDVLLLVAGYLPRYKDVNSLASSFCHAHVNLNRYLYQRAKHFALLLAAEQGRDRTVQRALDMGLDVNEMDEFGGFTALSLAVRNGHISTVKLLLGVKGIDINSGKSTSPLKCAMASKLMGIVELLLSYDGVSSYSLEGGLFAAVNDDNVDGFRLIMRNKNFNLNARNENGETPLAVAVRRQSYKVADILIDHSDVDLNCTAADTLVWSPFRSPIIVVLMHGRIESAERLLRKEDRLDFEARDDFGNTALHISAEKGHFHNCKLLLKTSPDLLNLQNSKGDTPFFNAVRKSQMDICEFFLDQTRVDVHVRNEEGSTLVLEAAAHGSLHFLKRILRRAGKEQIHAHDNSEYTPLLQAARHSRVELLEYLIRNGADPAKRDGRGETSLMIASRKNASTEPMKILLATNKVDVNAYDYDGHTALMCAARSGSVAAIKLLLEVEGIDINAYDNLGWSAVVWARSPNRLMRHKEVEKILSREGAFRDARVFGFGFRRLLFGKIRSTCNSRKRL